MTNPFEARWTAKGNNLCLGHWEITYAGKMLSLPLARRKNDMGTYAIYCFIDPEDHDFAEGLPQDAWVEANRDWLVELFAQHAVPVDEAHLNWFYQAVNPQDWRCGSCGGCL